MSRLSTFQGRLKLLMRLSRVNLRMSSITLIGLTIALSMIAVCTVYLETNKANYYLESSTTL
ncbi:MAG: hypothetical protein ACFE9L_03640 [Candidatus Hodarchaeota archaeon]